MELIGETAASDFAYDPIGHLIALFESPREPAVQHARFRLRAPIATADLRRSYSILATAHPKLAAALRCDVSEFRWIPEPDLERATRIVFDHGITNEDDFLQIHIPLSKGPLIRVALFSPTDLGVAVHHSLGGGQSSPNIGLAMVTAAMDPEFDVRAAFQRSSLDLQGSVRFDQAPLSIPSFAKAIVERIYQARFAPPLILGRATAGEGDRRYLLKAEFQEAEIETVRNELERVWGATFQRRPSLNDWLICCAYRTVIHLIEQGVVTTRVNGIETDRVAIDVPLSLSGEIAIPTAIYNAASHHPYKISRRRTKSVRDLLRVVMRESQDVRRQRLRTSASTLAIWFLRNRMKLVSKFQGQDPESWKNSCTLCLTNVHRLASVPGAERFVDCVWGGPHTLEPVGLVLCVVQIGQTLTLSANGNTYALSREAARRFLDVYRTKLFDFSGAV